MKSKEELKQLFENGDKPIQEDFWNWLDSYWHKSEQISNTSLNLIVQDEFIYSPIDNTEITGIGKIFTFPEGIKAVGGFMYSAPAKNTISGITLPSTLEKIKSTAFMHQFLKGRLKIPGSCKIIESSAFFSANSNITELILEEGIETIGSGAFQLSGGTNLPSLYIPYSVQSVGQNAFNIPNLQTVSAPTGLDLSNAGIPATAVITYR